MSKNRDRQRANKKLHSEELLETRNAYGVRDPTPYEAVLRMRGEAEEERTWKGATYEYHSGATNRSFV